MSELTDQLMSLRAKYEPFRETHEAILAEAEGRIEECRKKYDPKQYARNFLALDSAVKKYHSALGLVFADFKRKGAANARITMNGTDLHESRIQELPRIVRAARCYAGCYQTDEGAIVALSEETQAIDKIDITVMKRHDFTVLQLAMLGYASEYADSIGKVLAPYRARSLIVSVIEPPPVEMGAEADIRDTIEQLVVETGQSKLTVCGFEKHNFQRDLQNVCGQQQTAFGWLDLFD